jgi:hypothetical protein
MSCADRIIRRSTALAVLGVAAVAAVASYEHAYDLVREQMSQADCSPGPGHGRRPDLREFDGDARFCAPQDAGSSAGAGFSAWVLRRRSLPTSHTAWAMA